MEETKIWAVDGTSAEQLDTNNRMETEGLLEDILTANPEMLEGGLQLVGRQTSTAGGPLDLLGVDSDGRLVVFELKRGRLNREAVAQVIDYASSLNAMDEETLYKHISERSGSLGIQKIENFGEWFSSIWAEGDIDSLLPPRMVLVGLGVDNTTERMVKYLASGEIDVALLTFQGFVNSDGKTLLSRNVEVERADTAVSTPRKPQSRNRRSPFVERAQALTSEVRDVLSDIENMFKSQTRGYTNSYANTRMNFNLDYSAHDMGTFIRAATLFIEIDESGHGVKVGFHPLSIRLASMCEFEKIKNEGFEYEKADAQALVQFEDINYEIKFPLHSLEEWNARKEQLTALTRKVWEGYDAAKTKALAGE